MMLWKPWYFSVTVIRFLSVWTIALVTSNFLLAKHHGIQVLSWQMLYGTKRELPPFYKGEASNQPMNFCLFLNSDPVGSLHWRRLLLLRLQCQTSAKKWLLKNDWKSHGNPEQKAQACMEAQGMTHTLPFLPSSFGYIYIKKKNQNHHSKRDLQIVLPRKVKLTTLCLTAHSIENLFCRSCIS